MPIVRKRKGNRKPYEEREKRRQRAIKEGKPKPPPPKPKDAKKQGKYARTKLAQLNDETRTHQIVQYLTFGYDLPEIAEALDVNVENVRSLINTALRKTKQANAGMIEQWQIVALERTEVVMRKIMERFEDAGPMDNDDIRNLTNAMVKLTDAQTRILGHVGEETAAKPQTINIFNQTMLRESDLYHEAAAGIQKEKRGEVLPEYTEYEPVEDEEYIRLDGILDS